MFFIFGSIGVLADDLWKDRKVILFEEVSFAGDVQQIEPLFEKRPRLMTKIRKAVPSS